MQPSFCHIFLQIKLFSLINLAPNKFDTLMNAKKKPSNGSQPTQPEPRKRFIRRNSFHTLHCRSGSLNKLITLSQELTSLQQHTQPSNKQTHHQLRQTVHLDATQFNRQLSDLKDIPLKRGTGSMKLEPQAKQKGYSAQKYEYLKKEYELRGQQLQLLESQCQRLQLFGNQQREKRKILEQQLRMRQLEIKRLQKRTQKYKVERDQLQQNIELMTKHIQQLQKTTFNKATCTLQSYREQVLQLQLKRIHQILEKSRSTRELELLQQVDQLRQQKFNQQQLNSRAQVANNMLKKQLEQTEQELDQIRKSIHQAITNSPEYSELRQKYREALLQLREMRRQMSRIEQGSGFLLQHTLLTLSEFENELN